MRANNKYAEEKKKKSKRLRIKSFEPHPKHLSQVYTKDKQ